MLDGVLSPRVACTVSQSVAVVVERGLAAVSPIVRASHVVTNFVWGKGREGRGRNKEECREVAECAEREVRSFLGCAIYTPRRIFSVYNTKSSHFLVEIGTQTVGRVRHVEHSRRHQLTWKGTNDVETEVSRKYIYICGLCCAMKLLPELPTVKKRYICNSPTRQLNLRVVVFPSKQRASINENP